MNAQNQALTVGEVQTVDSGSRTGPAIRELANATGEHQPRQQPLAFADRGIGQRTVAVLACQDNLEFLREQPNDKFKLIVTSPPYNIGKSYESRLTLDEYLASQQQVIQECVRVLHPQGSICWQVGNYAEASEIIPLDCLLFPVFRALGLKLRNRIIWHFGHGLHARKRLSGRYETINWWTKGDDYTWHLDPIRVPSKYPGKRHFKGPRKGELSGNPKGKNPSDVWEFPNVKSNHPEKTVHPCQFPIELVERLVLSMTDEGDDVLDPYVGVGSSVIASLKHQRNGYGCDIVEQYIAIARRRLRDLQAGILKTRPMGKPIYNPALPNGGH
ncbi:MAG: site-specific DNA-methyltransferase [Chloroflexi bacterium]|nr:site-specific DNA-methyltransferase [Chloroflexota bacterium]